jgi:hypothetical protein
MESADARRLFDTMQSLETVSNVGELPVASPSRAAAE